MIAKMVSSLPTSTFKPGLIRVPRWRIRILPESTCSPAYFLTPRRWAFESLPLRTEPPPFLCAMTTSLSYFFSAGFVAGFFAAGLAAGFFAAGFLAAGFAEGLAGFFRSEERRVGKE